MSNGFTTALKLSKPLEVNIIEKEPLGLWTDLTINKKICFDAVMHLKTPYTASILIDTTYVISETEQRVAG